MGKSTANTPGHKPTDGTNAQLLLRMRYVYLSQRVPQEAVRVCVVGQGRQCQPDAAHWQLIFSKGG
jgi:hypothetical protein